MTIFIRHASAACSKVSMQVLFRLFMITYRHCGPIEGFIYRHRGPMNVSFIEIWGPIKVSFIDFGTQWR